MRQSVKRIVIEVLVLLTIGVSFLVGRAPVNEARAQVTNLRTINARLENDHARHTAEISHQEDVIELLKEQLEEQLEELEDSQ